LVKDKGLAEVTAIGKRNEKNAVKTSQKINKKSPDTAGRFEISGGT
jgi:hypothetical protein